MTVETNSGVWLEESLRAGAVGTWWSAASAGGHSLGLLQLPPSLVTEPAARDRVAAAVAAVRAINSRGIMRTTELLLDTKRAWLVIASRPVPTLAELLAAAPALDPGAAAAVAVDVADALRDLHAAGLSHGDLAADTVIVTSGGRAMLVEVGVLSAMRASPNDVGRDQRGWAALVRSLADISAPSEAHLLVAAAATAESGDLAFAVRRLAHDAEQLPDFGARESLVEALPSAASAPRTPRPRSTVESPGTPVRLRFGRGVPLSATRANRRRSGRERRRPHRPSRALWWRALWWRALWWVVAVALLASSVGALLWWPGLHAWSG